MPLTRRSEGAKLHLLKAAAQRVGFLAAEFRRLRFPPSNQPTPPDAVGAFIATITETQPNVADSLLLDLKPIGGVFPKGTMISLTVASDIVGLENYTVSITLQTQATGEQAVALLQAVANLGPINIDQGLGLVSTGFTSTVAGPGLLQLDLVNASINDFDVANTSITIAGGGTTVTYQGTT